MDRILLLIVFSMSLQGCWLGTITSALSPSQSGGTQVNTEANLGKTNTKALSSSVSEANQDVKNNSGEVIAGSKSEQKAQSINNQHGMTTGDLLLISLFFMVMCLIIPSPLAPLYSRLKRGLS